MDSRGALVELVDLPASRNLLKVDVMYETYVNVLKKERPGIVEIFILHFNSHIVYFGYLLSGVEGKCQLENIYNRP
jgi:molybdopterin biosynthesis enzyme MoaB